MATIAIKDIQRAFEKNYGLTRHQNGSARRVPPFFTYQLEWSNSVARFAERTVCGLSASLKP